MFFSSKWHARRDQSQLIEEQRLAVRRTNEQNVSLRKQNLELSIKVSLLKLRVEQLLNQLEGITSC
jgi:hypothetical protein